MRTLLTSPVMLGVALALAALTASACAPPPSANAPSSPPGEATPDGQPDAPARPTNSAANTASTPTAPAPGSTAAGNAPPKDTEAPKPSALESQLALGRRIYGERCAACHGDDAKSGRPSGFTVGRHPSKKPEKKKQDAHDFRTAWDVASWSQKSMPPAGMWQAGSELTTDEALAVVAFALSTNGAKLDGPLQESSAKARKLE